MSGYIGSKRSSSLVSATEITLDGAKLKSSGDSITKSDGTTAVLSESSGTVTFTTNNAVIEGSSSGNLVRITQTGTGNALVVEDSANPDSTPFVVNSSGTVLVGSSDPSESSIGLRITDAGQRLVSTATYSTNAQSTYVMYSTGASANRFYVRWDGQISATQTSISGISDESLKENIRDLETGLSEIISLKPRRFDWKAETNLDQTDVAGFIAQEVEPILPDLVYDYQYNDTEIKKSLKLGDMIPTLVKAIQEQQEIIESQQSQIDSLTAKTQEQDLTIASLISRIEALETQP